MDLIEELTKLERREEEKASDFSSRIMKLMTAANFKINKEVSVIDRGDGRSGRIDIVASKNNIVYAIELDRVTPRKKSIFKVSNFLCDYALVVSRECNHVFKVLPDKKAIVYYIGDTNVSIL